MVKGLILFLEWQTIQYLILKAAVNEVKEKERPMQELAIK
jgi:hypothetical protein